MDTSPRTQTCPSPSSENGSGNLLFFVVIFVNVGFVVVVCWEGGARLRILFDQKRCPRGLRCFAQIAEQGLNLSGS